MALRLRKVQGARNAASGGLLRSHRCRDHAVHPGRIDRDSMTYDRRRAQPYLGNIFKIPSVTSLTMSLFKAMGSTSTPSTEWQCGH